MANLTTQYVTRAGVNPTYDNAAGGGDTFTPDADTLLHVTNGGGSPITVTIVTPKNDLPNLSVDDLTVTVPNGSNRLIGPCRADIFADPTDGLADITYSGVSSVVIAVFKLAKP
jgi:hypothetical protein